MRINHNLTAINTHRQMGISELDGSKSMEKLSSGFRINRAGDDAAGLAISEKMRGQVRGLSMASKNSSDTISLIQTAEGALAETHSILQRMRELSVQSANDTNVDKDREELQAEVTQLKAEIDRIGNTTEFNTKKLLEGSATGVRDEIVGTLRVNNNSSVVIDANWEKAMAASIGEDRSWAFDGAYMLVKVNQTYDADNNRVFKAEDYNLVGPDGNVYKFKTYTPGTKTTVSDLESGTIIAEGGKTTHVTTAIALNAVAPNPFSSLGNANLVTGAAHTEKEIDGVGINSILVAGSSVTLKNGQALSVTTTNTYVGLGIDSIGDDGTLKNGAAIVGKLEVGKTMTLDDGTVIKNNGTGNISVENGAVKLTAALETTTLASGWTIAAQSSLANAATTTFKANVDIVEASYLSVTKGEIQNNLTIGNTGGLVFGDVEYLTAGSVLAKGSAFTINDGTPSAGKDYSLKIEVKGKEVEIAWNNTTKVLTVGGEIVAADKSITLEDGTVLTHNSKIGDPNTATGNMFVEHGRVTIAEDIDATAGFGANLNGLLIAKDSTLASGSKLGSALKNTVNLMAGTVITSEDKFFTGSVTFADQGKNFQFSANRGDALATRYDELKVTDSFTFIFTEYDAASSALNDSIMSQIGANSGQTTFLSINDMRSKALGVADVDISTKWGAATAIETVNNALQKVSHQRSSLGALQNRLEHTIKNLDTAAENLQAAESRIRDVDMAKEVMEFTRTNILQQAAQAMLAQANQQPQSVLQLLR
ncbi:flagellin [Fibrobacteres bacterium R8-0-B4]